MVGGGVRVDVNAMLGVGGDIGYGGCEPRIEGIVQCTTQMQDMKPNKWNREIHMVKAQQRNVDSRGIYCKTKACSYCGLTSAHPKGSDCPAYGVQCEICHKYDNFTAICRFN